MKNNREILCLSLNLAIVGRIETFLNVRSEPQNFTQVLIVAYTAIVSLRSPSLNDG